MALNHYDCVHIKFQNHHKESNKATLICIVLKEGLMHFWLQHTRRAMSTQPPT